MEAAPLGLLDLASGAFADPEDTVGTARWLTAITDR
jgi:hypothetical protein